jgi:hypothetical protein
MPRVVFAATVAIQGTIPQRSAAKRRIGQLNLFPDRQNGFAVESRTAPIGVHPNADRRRSCHADPNLA